MRRGLAMGAMSPPAVELQSVSVPLVKDASAGPSAALAPPEVVEAKATAAVQWLCINCDGFTRATQFTLLSAGVFLFFMLCGFVEEYLFRELPDFKFGWYLTVFELFCFSTFAGLERGFRGQDVFSNRASFKAHMFVAFAMTASRGLTNVSLQYLNYPTQVIFKSMKLITVMIGSVLYLRKSYSLLEYCAAGLLVASAALFSLGDVDVAPSYDTTGLAIVLISLVFDALHSNVQEGVLRDAPESEVMLFSNCFAALCTLVVCWMVGELGPAVAFCSANPIAYFLFVFRACVIYMGVLCFVTLIKQFGAVNATTVTTVRKILSILFSFIAFPKPFTYKYLYGIAAFALSLTLSVVQMRAKQAPAAPRRPAV